MGQKFPKTIQTRRKNTQPARRTWTRIFKMDASETMLVPFSAGEQLVETDMTQLPATNVRRAQPWKRAQDQREFDLADVHAPAPTAVDIGIEDISNMAVSTQPGEALIPVQSVK
jgi:hypothetical protein